LLTVRDDVWEGLGMRLEVDDTDTRERNDLASFPGYFVMVLE